MLTDLTKETFALLCKNYADYRNAEDFRNRKLALDYFFKFCREFGLTPRSQKPTKRAAPNFFAENND